MITDIYVMIGEMKIAIDILVLLKLVLAIFIGRLIGRERKRNEKPGGSRTFALVCLGATLMSILSLELKKAGYDFDFVRLLSYGIASIGFLGSGIIIQNKNRVEGLTSASTLWAIVPVGFFIGLGFYQIAFISAFFIYLILDSKYKRIRKKKKKIIKEVSNEG
jgi:putative Mg2+ transporter-C (MgtC) family protein